LLSSFYTHRV